MSFSPLSRQSKEDKLKHQNRIQSFNFSENLGTFWFGVNEYSLTLNNTSKFYSNKNKKKFDSLYLSHKYNRKYIKSKYIIDPTNPAKIFWDIFIILLVFYSVILIPFRIGFDINFNSIINTFDSIYIPIFFAFDIILSFNTAYVDSLSDQLVESRLFIARKYLRGWFIIDVLATIPFDVISGLSAIRIIRLFRLNKMTQSFAQLQKIFEKTEVESDSTKYFSRSWLDYGAVDIILVIFQFLFLIHILACMWNFLTLPQSMGNENYNWKTEFGFQNASIGSLYIAGFYFNIITLLTIGYGDIHPVNNAERFFAVCIMIGGVIFFSIIISIIEGLMLRYNPGKYAYNEKMKEFKEFLLDTNVSNNDKDHARRAYGFYLQHRSSFNEDNIFRDLTPDLKTEFIYNIYNNEIQKINIFKVVDNTNVFNSFISEERKFRRNSNSFDKNIYSAINNQEITSSLITQKGFSALLFTNARPFEFFLDDIILKEGDVCSDLIFILRGKVAITNSFRSQNLISGFVTEGNYLGDLEYYNNCVAMATYKAIRPGLAMSVSFKDLKAALDLYPKCANEFLTLFSNRNENFKFVLREFSQKFSYTTSTSPDKINPRRKSFLLSSVNLFQYSEDEDDKFNETNEFITLNKKNSSFIFSGNKKRETYFKSSTIWLDGELKEAKLIIDNFLNTKFKKNYFRNKLSRVVVFSPSHYESKWSIYTNDEKLEVGSVIEIPISYFSNKFILFPEGNLKYLWDILVALIIFYITLVIPLEVAFDEFIYKNSILFQYFTSLILGIDVIFSFRTAFYSPPFDAYVISGDIIASKYFKGWFFADIISALPINLIVEEILKSLNQNVSNYLRFLRLFRLLRVSKLFKFFAPSPIIDNIQERSRIPSVIYSILYVLMKLGLILHFLACLWWGVTSLVPGDNFNEQLIVDIFKGNANVTLGTKYLTVIYYIMTTISTTGYGDISALTTTDRFLCIILAMIGATIFGFIIANMKQIFLNYGMSSKVANDRLSLIHQYLTEKKCSHQFAESFMVHFERKYKELKLYNVDEMVNKLPPRLGNKLLYSFYINKIEMIPIFKYISNYTVILYIFQFLKPIYCDEGHIITKEGEPVENIYFITSGSARCFKRYTKKKSLNKDQIKSKMHRSLRYKSSNLYGSFSHASTTIFEESSHSSSTPIDLSRTNSKMSLISLDDSENIDFKNHDRRSTTNFPHLDLDSLRLVASTEKEMDRTRSRQSSNASVNDILVETMTENDNIHIRPSLILASSHHDFTTDKTPKFNRPLLKKRVSSMTFDINETKNSKPKANISDTLYNFSKIEKNFKRYSPNQLKKYGFELVTDLVHGDFIGYMGLLNAHKKNKLQSQTPFSSKFSDSSKIPLTLDNIDGITHEYSVCATLPCTLYTLNITDIYKIINKNKSIAIELQSALTKAIIAQHREFKFRSKRSKSNKFIQVLKRKFEKFTTNVDIQDSPDDDLISLNSIKLSEKSAHSKRVLENSYFNIINKNKRNLVNFLFENNDLLYESDEDDDPYFGYQPKSLKINQSSFSNLEPNVSTSNFSRQSSNSSIKSKVATIPKKTNIVHKKPNFKSLKISREEMLTLRKNKLNAIKKNKKKLFHQKVNYYQMLNTKFSNLVEKSLRVSSLNFHIESLNNILNYHNDLIQYFNDYIQYNHDILLNKSDNLYKKSFIPVEEYDLISSFNSKYPTLEFNKISCVFNQLINTTNTIIESLPFFESFELFIKHVMEPLEDDEKNIYSLSSKDNDNPSLSLDYFDSLLYKSNYIKENIDILCEYIRLINKNIEKDLPIETDISVSLSSPDNNSTKLGLLKLQKIKLMNYFDLYKYKLAVKSYFNPPTSPIAKTLRSGYSNKSIRSYSEKSNLGRESFNLKKFLNRSCKSISKLYSTNLNNFQTLFKFFVTPTQVLKKYYRPNYLRKALSFSIIDSNIIQLVENSSNDDFKLFQNRRRSFTYPSTSFNEFRLND